MLNTSNPETIGKLLSGLLGREVAAGKKASPGQALSIAGIYKSATDQPVAVCLADVTFGANAGAALSLIPAAAAKDAVKAGRIVDQDLQDNFGEVLNVCARLFTDKDAHRVTLKEVYFPPEVLPEEIKKALPGATQRLDLELNINGYGKGSFALLVL